MYKQIPHFSPDEILVYLRKSRADDVTLSVEEVLAKHETILREWAKSHLDAPIPEENFYREIVSGETIDGRPEVQKVLQRMQSPKIKAILVVEVQRLSRGDLEDCGRLMKLLRYSHTQVITPLQIYDLEDEYDRDFFERELKRGNEYLEYIKKIQKRGTLLSVQSGNFVGSIPPYGFDKTYIMDGKRKCPTLMENKTEADIVRLIYEWYVYETIGDTTIASKLNDMGIRPRSGGTWNKATIKEILTNEHYIGMVRWNKRVQTKEVIDLEIISKSKRTKNYELYKGKHPGIISAELFKEAQAIRGGKPRIKVSTTLVNPLSSLVYCKCGRALVYRLNRSNNSQARLICEKHRFCDNGSVMYNDILEDVCQTIKNTIGELQLELSTVDNNPTELYEQKISILEKRMSDLEEKEISIWETYAEKGMPREIFEKLKQKVELDKDTTLKALNDAKSNMPQKIDYQQKILLFSDALDALHNTSISAESKNRLLKEIIKRITVTKPKSFRLTEDTVITEGMETQNGWVTMPYELDIELKI